MSWCSSRWPRVWGGEHGRLPRCETLRLRSETLPSLSCKIPALAPAIAKYCCSCKTPCASPQQRCGVPETTKNCIEPILMGEYRDSSLLISFPCVKWLSDQICRDSCKFGRSATITLSTGMISEGCYPALSKSNAFILP